MSIAIISIALTTSQQPYTYLNPSILAVPCRFKGGFPSRDIVSTG